MKTNTLIRMAITIALLATSCNEKRELESQSARDAPEAVRQISDAGPGSSAALQSAEMKYGKLDADGFPVDQSLGMNSDKISKEQRLELRQPLPEGYQVGPPIVPRIVMGASDRNEWRKVGDVTFCPGNKEGLAKLLGLDPTGIPPGIFGDDWVLKSPSGGRVIIQSGGSADRALLFEAKDGIIDGSSGKKVHNINFDDKRRAFIFWDCFVNESLIVGHLMDDEDLEDLPSRQVLYAYDVDKKTLRRVKFPEEIQVNEGDPFVVCGVEPSASAVLLRWDKKSEPVGVYLEP